MTVAAVVAGNTVVLKPSSQSPVIAAKFMELVKEAEVPDGVINFLTGSGAKIGDYLVADARTRMIAFTGSKNVGLHIQELASRPVRGQRWIKRVIAEMGGKNAIVIDQSAPLEEALHGVLASSFGYQGQKCSACSRVYIHPAVYDAFVERFVKLVKQMSVGPAENPVHSMGPVISESAREGILQYISCGKKHGRLLAGGFDAGLSDGFFIQPTVFDRMAKSCKVLQEEIFGPVVVLNRIKSFEEGIAEANASDYGLTGAIYSTNPAHILMAEERFFCGNLYINRKCT
jgi:1-pyrroline-5-carboxylate dehydrogenase